MFYIESCLSPYLISLPFLIPSVFLKKGLISFKNDSFITTSLYAFLLPNISSFSQKISSYISLIVLTFPSLFMSSLLKIVSKSYLKMLLTDFLDRLRTVSLSLSHTSESAKTRKISFYQMRIMLVGVLIFLVWEESPNIT